MSANLIIRIASLVLGVVVLALLIVVATFPPSVLDRATFSFVFAWVWACLGILTTAIALETPTLRWLGATATGLAQVFMVVAAVGSSDRYVPRASIVIWFEVAMALAMVAALAPRGRQANELAREARHHL